MPSLIKALNQHIDTLKEHEVYLEQHTTQDTDTTKLLKLKLQIAMLTKRVENLQG